MKPSSHGAVGTISFIFSSLIASLLSFRNETIIAYSPKRILTRNLRESYKIVRVQTRLTFRKSAFHPHGSRAKCVSSSRNPKTPISEAIRKTGVAYPKKKITVQICSAANVDSNSLNQQKPASVRGTNTFPISTAALLHHSLLHQRGPTLTG